MLLLGVLVPSPSVLALRKSSENLGVPPWPTPRERGSYRVRLAATGKPLWDVTWETTVTQNGGQTQVQIHEQGHGQPLHYKEPIVWDKRMFLLTAPVVQVRSLEGSRFTQDGKLLSRMEVQVDPRRRLLLYKDTGQGGSPTGTSLPWTPQTLPDEFLFHWVRTLNFNQSLAQEFFLVVSPTRRIRMRAFVRGRETLTTPAGTFSCYRVELLPYLGPLEIFPLKTLVPKLTLWCALDPPHFWVRYQGPVGGPGSPQAIIELMSFQRTAA